MNKLRRGIGNTFLEAEMRIIQKSINKETDEIENKEPSKFLDAIMILSGSEDHEIKSTAFSSLSRISEQGSTYETIMAQIRRDIDCPDANYMKFIIGRVDEDKAKFEEEFKDELVEQLNTGFISLLALAHDPTEDEVQNATSSFKIFLKTKEPAPDLDPKNFSSEQLAHIKLLHNLQLSNEMFFIEVF